MKIAIPILNYNKEGGIERHTWELVEKWKGEHEIHIFANGWVNAVQDVIFHKVPAMKWPRLCQILSFILNNSLILRHSNFDVIFNNGCGATIFQDIIVTATVHKAWAQESKKAGLKRFFLNPLHYYAFAIEIINYKHRRYKKVIAVSKLIEKHLTHCYNVPPEDIVVIHLGVNLEEFNPAKRIFYIKNIRDELKLSDDDILLSFVGKEFKRKGLEYIFQALHILKDERIKLLIVGKGEIETFKNTAFNLGINKNVFFIGHSNDVVKYYVSSDIFVFPSTFDAFGMVVLEAMASGLPCIVSKETGASELINDGEDGILLANYKDTGELANKIKLLVENQSLREEIGLKARGKAELYSWDDVAERTMSVLKKVAGK